MKKKAFTPPKLVVDYEAIEDLEDHEAKIILTNDILKKYKLEVDKTKIEDFRDINFISLFE